MLEVLSRNYNNRNESAALFELASEYIPTTEDKLPVEKATLVVGMYGNNADFFTVKGMAEQLLEKLSVTDYDIAASSEVIQLPSRPLRGAHHRWTAPGRDR